MNREYWIMSSDHRFARASELAREDGCCEHVEAGAPIFAVGCEDDSFGPLARIGNCEACYHASVAAHAAEMVVCNDCKKEVPRSQATEWKWWDFYAPQGDEPLVICDQCRKLPKHIERVRADRADREETIDAQDRADGKRVFGALELNQAIEYNNLERHNTLPIGADPFAPENFWDTTMPEGADPRTMGWKLDTWGDCKVLHMPDQPYYAVLTKERKCLMDVQLFRGVFDPKKSSIPASDREASDFELPYEGWGQDVLFKMESIFQSNELETVEEEEY